MFAIPAHQQHKLSAVVGDWMWGAVEIIVLFGSDYQKALNT